VTGDKLAETVSKIMPEETSEAASVEASFEDIRLRLRGVLIEAATSDKLAKTISDVIDESSDAEKDMRLRLRDVLIKAATSDKLAKTISEVIDESNDAEKEEAAPPEC